MSGADFLQLRGTLTAFVTGIGTAGMEYAALEFVGMLGQFSGQGNSALLPLEIRNGCKQCLRVGVQRAGEQFLSICLLYKRAQIHHTDPMGNVANHTDVMGDKQQTQIHLLLKTCQHIENLGLDGNIQDHRM